MNIAMMRSSSMLESPPHLNFWSVPACRVWRALRPCLCSGCFHSSYFFFIVIIRLRYHQPTKDYAARKTREGKGKLEIIRCVKRFIAREAYRALIAIRNGGTGRRTPANAVPDCANCAWATVSPNSRSARRCACRPAASARSNEANGTCPNSSDGPSNGFTPSPVQNNTPKRLTMYRSIEIHLTSIEQTQPCRIRSVTPTHASSRWTLA